VLLEDYFDFYSTSFKREEVFSQNNNQENPQKEPTSIIPLKSEIKEKKRKRVSLQEHPAQFELVQTSAASPKTNDIHNDTVIIEDNSAGNGRLEVGGEEEQAQPVDETLIPSHHSQLEEKKDSHQEMVEDL
jgi:hypothetical protein